MPLRPGEDDLDDEIRGHLAVNIKERIDRGEDPASARRAALQEFGYMPDVRDEMRRVWYSRWYDHAEALARDIRFAARSLLRAKALSVTVVVTLALGVGANAAVFSVVRSVLLRPLVNREADRLIYIRQDAQGLGIQNLTFSVPEITDFKSRATTVSAFGDFSTVQFTLNGFGREPRLVRAGVVNGSFFEVMGLRPVLGRLLGPADDGEKAAGAAVLTHRFWKDVLNRDPSVIGQTIRLGSTPATVIGVLEPSVPYPTETEIIANMVTSPHHLGATMNTDRKHRMTDLFGRLIPGATVDAARAELSSLHTSMLREHPDAYSPQARIGLQVRTLQEQIASPARTILLVLMAAAAVVFIIACSNVANLILARSVRRETELAVRAALGASRGALRRTLLAESLVLCAAGAGLGLFLAGPLVSVAASYAARFSVRALESTVDAGVLWLGAGLAVLAAVLLAYIPRLPSSDRTGGLGLATGGVRITPGTNRRLRIFATTQVACTFVLLAASAMLVTTLTALQTANTGYDLRHVLAIDLPDIVGPGLRDPSRESFLQETVRRIGELPGVEGVAIGGSVPWRDRSTTRLQFVAEGYQPANGEESPTGRLRYVSPRYFAVLGVPLLAGRGFTDEDRTSKELVAIVNRTVAQRLFPNGDALNRRLTPTNLGTNLGSPPPSRIVGVVADVDEDNVVQEPSMIVYYPIRGGGSRLFVRAAGDPRLLVPSVTRTIRAISADQAVERPATLEDIRTEVLAPERLNAFVFSALGGIALLISIVGVAGVLAFSVSARTREFGIRLAVGSTPRALRTGVVWDGVRIATIGIAAGAAGGYALVRVAQSFVGTVQLPGALPATAAAIVLFVAAIVASLMPATRASRVDVLQALRSE
ncbi:MAG TPA: ADOP family duplicated permease [Vicinamibacterales bacterium]|jgi:predicted permease